jgi:hypothetical protein
VLAAPPCPPVSAVLTASRLAPTPALVGDVDGDGTPDRVAIRFAPRLRTDCGIVVAVKTRHGVKAARVPYGSEAGKFPRSGQFIRLSTFPFLNGLYRIDGRPGLEIVLTSWAGASTLMLHMFTFTHGRLVPVRAPTTHGLWEGGCCGQSTGIDCSREMLRITATSWLDTHHLRIDRAFYTLRNARLTFIKSRTFRLSDKQIRFSRESSALFESCQGVRARRQR